MADQSSHSANSGAAVPFNLPTLVGDELRHISAAINTGKLCGDGKFTQACNARIKELTGAGAALLTHSCTAALEMAALLINLAPGDEVIMPSFTFVSTANAVVLRGAVPVFVDIDPLTLNLDPDLVSQAITPRTKAIFAVHYAGFPADMDRLAQIAQAHDLFLVEDAAQALSSTWHGRPAGSLGDMATFSFHETKNVISGEGGALTINRPELVERAEIIREKGTDRSRFLRGQIDKYTWVDVGSSYLPGELIAAFLYGQLEQEAEIRARRLSLFDRYTEGLADLETTGRVRLPKAQDGAGGNGHMFYLLLRDISDRDAFIAHMRAGGITTPFHYVPLHSAPAGLRFGRADRDLAVTDDVSARLARLPLYFGAAEVVDRVIVRAHQYFQDGSVA